MRKFLTVLTALGFCVVWPLSIILVSLQFTFLNENFYFDAFDSTKFYTRITDTAFQNSNMETFAKAFPGDPALASTIQNALIQSITPDWLKKQSEAIISSVMELITTPGAKVSLIGVSISLAEPKAALQPILETTNNQLPDKSLPDWVQLFNSKVPDKIGLKYIIAAAVNTEPLFTNPETMSLPGNEYFETQNVKILDKQLASIQKALVLLKTVTYVCIGFLATCLFLLLLLPRGFASKIKSIGLTLWIASIGTVLSAGMMYISQSFIVSVIMQQLPFTSEWQLLAQDVLSELLKNYSLFLLWPSVIGFGIGISLHILSKFIRKNA